MRKKYILFDNIFSPKFKILDSGYFENIPVSCAVHTFWLLLIKIPIVYSFSLSKPNKNQNMMHFDGFMLRQNAKIAVFNILIDEYQRWSLLIWWALNNIFGIANLHYGSKFGRSIKVKTLYSNPSWVKIIYIFFKFATMLVNNSGRVFLRCIFVCCLLSVYNIL